MSKKSFIAGAFATIGYSELRARETVAKFRYLWRSNAGREIRKDLWSKNIDLGGFKAKWRV